VCRYTIPVCTPSAYIYRESERERNTDKDTDTDTDTDTHTHTHTHTATPLAASMAIVTRTASERGMVLSLRTSDSEPRAMYSITINISCPPCVCVFV